MGTEDRQQTDHLDALETLYQESGRGLSFFQAVGLVQRCYKQKPKVGTGGSPGNEMLRFVHDPSFAFPVRDINRIRCLPSGGYELVTAFLGLFGSVSPLPNFYTEDILWAEPDKDGQTQDTVKAFTDIFHHRVISLFYRAWEKYRYPVHFRENGADSTSGRVFSIFGFGTEGIGDAMNMERTRLLGFSGIFSQSPKSAHGLERLAAGFLGNGRVTVDQCIGRWVNIHVSQQTGLGRQHTVLGENFVLGKRVYDRMGKFSVGIGPVDFETFASLLPDHRRHARFREMISLYVGPQFTFDIRLILQYEKIPRFRLSSKGGSQLGWTTVFSPDRKKDMALTLAGA